jgi:PAS domain S-box-containing protein
LQLNSPSEKVFLDSLVAADELYEHAPCGYVSFVPQGTIIKINKTLLAWLQYECDEVLNKLKFSDLISKGGNLHFEMFFRPMINVDGNVRELRYELLKKDGSSLTVLISAATSKDPSGKIAAINAAVYDITDRKKYEDELLIAKRTADDERKRFKFLADLIPEMIWTATPSGEIDYVNDRFYEYFGSFPVKLTSQALLEKVHTEDREKFQIAWANCIKNTSELKCDLRLVSTNGQTFWHVLRAVPYLDECGNAGKWFGTCTNIDEHVKALQQKDDFINVASHELKTPLTSLKAILQLLKKNKNAPTLQLLPKLVEQANKSMEKVSALVNDLLNVSRMTAGHVSLKKTEFTVEDLVQACSIVFLDEKHELIVTGDSKLKLYADMLRIEQVIVNFINNAIKYAPDARPIHLVIERLGPHVKISVKDFGPGISRDKIPHLFDRYYRVDEGGAQYSGLGLGLYICADIIKRHNGAIGADSKPGEGSTFWFTLPAPGEEIMDEAL